MFVDNITVNAHSSIRIAAEKTLWFDPFHVKRKTNDADIIFVTHDHYDHLSAEDIDLVKKDDTVFVLPFSCKTSAKKAGMVNAIFLKPGECADIEGVSVRAVPAYNIAKQFHPQQNGWLGYVVTVDGATVYVAGDTDALECNSLIKCDVALVPIGGTYTMDALQAAVFVNKMHPQYVIPMHYGDIVGSLSDADTFIGAVDAGIRTEIKIN